MIKEGFLCKSDHPLLCGMSTRRSPELAKASGEPIFITNKGEDDGVYMSMAAYEEREKMFRHRDKIYAAELSRLSGEPVCTPEELDERMEELFRAYEK